VTSISAATNIRNIRCGSKAGVAVATAKSASVGSGHAGKARCCHHASVLPDGATLFKCRNEISSRQRRDMLSARAQSRDCGDSALNHLLVTRETYSQ
jgi:hypothetical protein